jgi:hypothetical protein
MPCPAFGSAMKIRLSTALIVLAAALLAAGPALGQGEPEAPTQSPPAHEASNPPPARPAKHREGPNPCMTPDPGFGFYDKWESISLGQMIAPQKGGIRSDGGFDLVVHFHGHEPVRKEFIKTGGGVVLVGIDLGLGSGPYETAFANPTLFPRILDSVEEHMKKRTGKQNAHVRHLALSSWSAGYGATSQILRQPAGKKVEAVILLDSLHAGYKEGTKGEVRGIQIAQFVDYARLATKKQRFMMLTHSSIIPPGYASTTEVAEHVVGELGGKLKKAKRSDVLGLEMIDRFDKGDFHVRGYEGNDKPDHCAHLGLMADIMKVHIVPRWKTPRGRAATKLGDCVGGPLAWGPCTPLGALPHVERRGRCPLHPQRGCTPLGAPPRLERRGRCPLHPQRGAAPAPRPREKGLGAPSLLAISHPAFVHCTRRCVWPHAPWGPRVHVGV